MRLFLFSFLLLISQFSFSQKAMFDICPLKNSEEIPSVTVFQQDGTTIDLKEYIGERKVIVVFYRGGWCPYCMRHLSALHEAKAEIDSLGFELIGITPDDFIHLDSSFQKSGDTDFQLFSDKEANAINAYGIGWKVNDMLYKKYKDSYDMDTEWWSGSKHHILPVPSIFIIKEGKIQYQHVDPIYKQRLSPEILLGFLKSM